MWNSRVWHLVYVFLLYPDMAEGQEKANPLSFHTRASCQGVFTFELLFSNINPFRMVDPSWANHLWKAILPHIVAVEIKFGRNQVIQTMSVYYAFLQLRFLEFVKLCQIQAYNFDLSNPQVIHHFSHFQFSERWRHLNIRLCLQHLADQEYSQPLVERKE